jgi:hypothetical protein
MRNIGNPEADGFYPMAQISLGGGEVEFLDRPPCELCGLPANISTPRLDGDVENKPHIDLCSSCDRKYQETLGNE